MKAKFKKGDKVRILDGSNIELYAGGWVPWNMRNYVGRVVTIKCVVKGFKDRVAYQMGEVDFTWDERGLELVESAEVKNPTIKNVKFVDDKTIVEWSDGTKTTVACQEGDTFDKEKGLAMAIAKKYLGNGHDYYETFKKHLDDVTFRFLAVKDNLYYFTKGKVYEAVNGRVTYDDGDKGCKYDSFEAYKLRNITLAKCVVELKEGDNPKEIMKQYEPKYYNARVVCVEAKSNCFTKGKIYNVIDGVVTDNYGGESRELKNIDDLNRFHRSQFIEIKEDK